MHACAARMRAQRTFRYWTRLLARNSNKSGHAPSRAAHPIWQQTTPGFLPQILTVNLLALRPPSLPWRTRSLRKTRKHSEKPPPSLLPAIKSVSTTHLVQPPRLEGRPMVPEVPQVVPNDDAAWLFARSAGNRATWPRRVRLPLAPFLPVPPLRGEEDAVAVVCGR